MRTTLSPLRPLIWLVLAAALLVAAIDTGAVVLTRIKVPDDVRRAGQVAAEAVANQPATRQTAQTAFDAAQAEARQHGIVVTTKDFTLYPDGRVALTAGKTAPTLLLKHVEALSRFAEVQTTVTVEKLPYS
jgi:hypothetical protein